MTTPHDGMTLVFSDDFSYSGSPPVDPSKWYIGDPRPGHAGFSNAKFIQLGDTNIGSVFTGGGGSPLSINACYNTSFMTPYGTDWISGLISTGFDDGSGVGIRMGYYEVVMTVPYDPNALGVSGGTGSGSGTWVGFWLLDQRSILGDSTYGTREVDTELYGVGNNQFPATSQVWPAATQSTSYPLVHNYWQWQVGGGGSGAPTVSDFQGTSTTFGMLVDQFNVTWYVNNVAQIKLPLFEPDSLAPMFMMIDIGMGGGWPIVPPTSPATSYPLIVTSANIWEAPMPTVTGVTGLSATPTSTTTMSITYSTTSLPAPTFTPAASPSTSGSAVTIGTVAPGTGGDTLTVTLTSDPTFSSGSSLAISSGNLVYTPGTITSGNAGTDTIAFTLNESNGASAGFTKAVTLSFVSGGPAIAHSVSANAGSGSSLVLPSLNVPVNSVIAVFATVTYQTVSSITDSSGLTWTLRKLENPGFYPLYLYWASTTTAIPADVITLNFSGSGSILSAVAFSVTGCSSLSTPFDSNGSLPAGSATDPVTVSTTATDTLLIAAVRGASSTSTAGSGFSLIAPSAGYLMAESATYTSVQTSLSVTDGVPGDAIAMIVDAFH